jgi:prepilin-type N-terminal cleavage/methylation domain-containing protein
MFLQIRQNRKGFSLPELMVVMAISTMAMFGMISVMTNLFNQQNVYESKADSKSHQMVMEKVIQKSITVVRPELFAPNRGFVYDPAAVSESNPLALTETMTPPFSENLVVNFTSAQSEPGTFFDPLITLPYAPYTFKLDSFTLAVMKVEIDPVTKQLNGQISRLFFSRCVSNQTNIIGNRGQITESESPGKSTMRLFSENVYPFITKDSGRTVVRCCPYSATPALSPNCSANNLYPLYVPKIFMVTLANNTPTAVVEYPQAGARESIGAAFILAFNNKVNPDYFRLIYADLENACQTSLSAKLSCVGKNPANFMAGGKAISLGTSFVNNAVRTKDFIRFGRVKKGFDTSGVILLGE